MINKLAILNDTTICIGCEECVKACKLEKKLKKDLPRRWKIKIDDLSSTRYTTVTRRPGNRFARLQCRHCLSPACVSVCPVGAMQKTSEGPVIYDSDKCMGCRYCMIACPYGIPRYDWDNPIPYVRKCDMCHERLKEGKQPACVEACPEKATIFGARDDLLKEARRRIQTDPDRYINKVVGETEIGGTSVLYISDISLDFLAFKPNLGDKPLPELTWSALKKVPYIASVMGGLTLGVWWIIGRRVKLAEEASRQKPTVEEETELTNSELKNSPDR